MLFIYLYIYIYHGVTICMLSKMHSNKINIFQVNLLQILYMDISVAWVSQRGRTGTGPTSPTEPSYRSGILAALYCIAGMVNSSKGITLNGY
jgi:hypothetical protein